MAAVSQTPSRGSKRLHFTDMPWGVLTHRGGHFQIGFGVRPSVAGLTGCLTAKDVASRLPGMPIIVVASLDLMRSGGAAPAKLGWKRENLFGQLDLSIRATCEKPTWSPANGRPQSRLFDSVARRSRLHGMNRQATRANGKLNDACWRPIQLKQSLTQFRNL